MPGTTHRRVVGAPSEKVVGLDRDPDEIIDALLAGGSVVIVGAPGSGKSHLVRAVADGLRRRGVDPVVLRSGESAPAGLGEPARPGSAPLVLVVDDALARPASELEAISHAVCTGAARVLMTAETDPCIQISGLPPVLAQLWLDGVVVRHDLQPLDDITADQLISCVVGDDVLDSVTRAVVTQRAAGSRMLLRELALDAAEARRGGGHEPWEMRRARAGSRLADALRTMVDSYDLEQQLALALVARLDGVEYTTLSRVVRSKVLDTLLGRRVVRETGPHRLLHATLPIAQEADHRLPPGRVDALVDELVTRVLTEPGVGPSRPVMRAAAASWHAGSTSIPAPADVDPALRGLVLGTAAAAANAEGRAGLALDYVALGFAVDGHPGLNLEASRALARLHRVDEAFEQLSQLDPAAVPTAELRGIVRWWASMIGWQPAGRSLGDIEAWLDAAGVTDPGVLCELEAQRAEERYLDLDWTGGEKHALRVIDDAEAGTLARLRSAVVASMCAAQLGRGADGLAMLAKAERINRDPVTSRPVSLRTELVLICFQAFSGVIAGSVPPHLDERLRYAVGVAAQRKDRSGLALAGIVSGVALGFAAGDDAVSELEFGAAIDRIDRIEYAVFRPLVGNLRASALARLGRVAEARQVLDEIDIEQLRVHRLFRYSRHIVEYDIAIAAGELGTAEAALVAAETERAMGDPSAGPSATDTMRRNSLTRTLDALDPAPRLEGGTSRVLTDREHEIALLVASRLSNKEIAQQLYLSVRTVESHIYAARGKLGAGSRRELGERVREQDARLRTTGR
ncbi:LuxR C-terminal-related transcriptional regulator [Herbiconiux sp. CPCC 205716]|uniref:LuxR C-terminal-related transcriptional regulator n=1 Tax=Herbiconiux gentiana TaxID=2970912 RepID=A0ABT2GCS1_9MICO|nr:LuxR C-terminal-related transcriptional regulator [Herbiconiux gentiana]MCS5714014.1 LuxR C-terminal-related transcriptional regulator [Herbiconiux gentiana]